MSITILQTIFQIVIFYLQLCDFKIIFKNHDYFLIKKIMIILYNNALFFII